ncbi:hypothetical protein C8Q80DRAFT_787324 [Daedaleopsis nitida]|nr:hypothetical protein C8Q80DRAFT_787324 [Daedaleopsis nitida]
MLACAAQKYAIPELLPRHGHEALLGHLPNLKNMESLSPSTSSSGSLAGSALARLLLAPDFEGSGSIAPRITELRFEDDFASGDLAASFSGQFASFYGLPYDNSPPPEEHFQDVVSERRSRESHLRSCPDGFSLPSASVMRRATGNATGDASTTLFTSSHFLLSDQSLLVDIPSTFSTIQDTLDSLIDAQEDSEPPPGTSHAPIRTHSTSIPIPTPLSVPTLFSQPIAREPRPVYEPERRGMTVQQLALDLPLSRSRSSSLSALIHALEDASPGWYQSLMDSASSCDESLSPLSTDGSPMRHHQSLLTPPWSDESFDHNVPTLASSSSSSSALGDVLEELELLAIRIARLPIPRPHTLALEVVETVFFPPSSLPSPPPCPTRHTSRSESRSPHLTDGRARRERQSTVVPGTPRALARGRLSFRRAASAQIVPSISSGSSIGDDNDNDTDKPAGTEPARRPKLNRALGLRSFPSASRLLAPAPKTPSWRKRDSSRPRVVTECAPPVPLPIATVATPDVQTKEAAPKTPRSAKFQSIFRIRPPPVPPVPVQVQDCDVGENAGLPTPPTFRRGVRLSEPPLRRLNRASPPIKNVRHFSSNVGPPPSLPQGTLGSFLPM